MILSMATRDLQLGDQEVTLNHLVMDPMVESESESMMFNYPPGN